jgi:hypothetical protein
MGDREAMQVWADELEQTGDARRELVAEQLAGRDGAAVIAAHWAEWVGRLDPKVTLGRWSGPHLAELAVGAAPAGWTPAELCGRSTMERLGRLALGPQVTGEGAGGLPRLRHLVCLGGRVGAPTLPQMETLSVAVGEGAAEDLARLVAGRLATLHSRCVAPEEDAFARALARAAWFPGLRAWTHRPATVAGVEALLTVAPLVARGGAGLTLLCEPPVLGALPPRVRELLPRATVSLLPVPAKPSDPEDSNGPVELSVVPRQAPMNFRSLPPRTETRRRSAQSATDAMTAVGSGFELTHAFTSCGWCGSATTRVIWESASELYSHFETTSYRRWEYECGECGLFNSMRRTHTS